MTKIPDDAAVLDALRAVEDPEAGMNIVDLGLVYGVVVGEGRTAIEMTMTTPACPVTGALVEQARAAAGAIAPAGTEVDVQLVW